MLLVTFIWLASIADSLKKDLFLFSFFILALGVVQLIYTFLEANERAKEEQNLEENNTLIVKKNQKTIL